MHIHENNINTKIENNYKNCARELNDFKNNVYLPMRNKIEALDYTKGLKIFVEATDIINTYCTNLHEFAQKYKISSQSKFESTFLEEISYYLFNNHSKIKDGSLSIFNKGIYAGLKINEDLSIGIIKKDVDFCIGKKVTLSIDNQNPISLIIPAISVEVKTYLDATMFGEIKSSSKTLKSSTPNSRAYVLIGYKNIANEHIIAARQDSVLDEIFVLQKAENEPIDANALYQYYTEIINALSTIALQPTINVPGRLLQCV